MREVALISAGFLVFVGLPILDDWDVRIGFAIFLLVGALLMRRHARTWPQEIRMTARGIACGELVRRHGVDRVPWGEIEKMDIFWNASEHGAYAPFLRIRLREGPFKARLNRSLLQRLSFARDVNIPLQVDAGPDCVLKTAEDFRARLRPTATRAS